MVNSFSTSTNPRNTPVVLSRAGSQLSRLSLIDSLDMRTTISQLSPQQTGIHLLRSNSLKGKTTTNNVPSKSLRSIASRNISEPLLPSNSSSNPCPKDLEPLDSQAATKVFNTHRNAESFDFDSTTLGPAFTAQKRDHSPLTPQQNTSPTLKGPNIGTIGSAFQSLGKFSPIVECSPIVENDFPTPDDASARCSNKSNFLG